MFIYFLFFSFILEYITNNNLQFVSQTENEYIVKNASGKSILVPKIWFKKELASHISHNFHEKWLNLAFLGLPIGGILSVIFAPLTIWKNSMLLRSALLNKHEIIHAKNLVITAIIILFPGLVFFILFLLHVLF